MDISAKAHQCTVVIPAFNEEAGIARCLAALLQDAPDDHRMEIIVAANGCVDGTVSAAREAAPGARIIELRHGSKTAAINAANEIASHYPRIYIDADVECSYATVAALIEALGEPGSMTAAPAIRFDLTSADRFMQAYYRVWQVLPYARSGYGGAGCYALSQAALEQVGKFPPIIGDDIWIHTRFARDQKRFVAQDNRGKPVYSIVRPPGRAIEQIRIEARRQNGNAEVLRRYPSPHNLKPGGAGAVRSAVAAGARLFDMAVYFSMKIAARLLAKWLRWRGEGTVWQRDQSSRRIAR